MKTLLLVLLSTAMMLPDHAVSQPAAIAPPPSTPVPATPLPAGAVEDSAGTSLNRARIANELAQARYYAAQADKPPSSDLPQWLPTLLGGLLAILAGVVTTWWTGRQTEGKARREQQRTYLRQKTQLRLAASELLAVLEPIARAATPPPYLAEELLYEKPVRPQVPDRSDKYYLKYDLVNTVYRLCAFLGWLELYRTDPTFLRGPPAESRSLEKCFLAIRNHLGAELQSHMKPVADAWRDGFILEGDQRAIGEKMLSRRRADFVIGYAEFCEKLFRDPPRTNPTDGAHPTSQNWWIWNATRFFVEIGKQPAQIERQPSSTKVVDLSLVRLSGVVASLNEIAQVVVE